jgi:hypothetical protein
MVLAGIGQRTDEVGTDVAALYWPNSSERIPAERLVGAVLARYGFDDELLWKRLAQQGGSGNRQAPQCAGLTVSSGQSRHASFVGDDEAVSAAR